MKRTTINMLCGFGILIPLVLLFWPMPYIMWHPLVATILRMIAAVSAQLLFCRISKLAWILGMFHKKVFSQKVLGTFS